MKCLVAHPNTKKTLNEQTGLCISGDASSTYSTLRDLEIQTAEDSLNWVAAQVAIPSMRWVLRQISVHRTSLASSYFIGNDVLATVNTRHIRNTISEPCQATFPHSGKAQELETRDSRHISRDH